MSRWPGGLIRKTAITPAGPFQDGAAKGVWTIMEATYWIKQGLWPIAGNSNPSQRAFFAGGTLSSSYFSNIYTIVISTSGNTTNFGNLSTNTGFLASGSSSTRGLFAGGGGLDGLGDFVIFNTIEYITFAASGSVADFGDLATARYNLAGCSNSTIAIFAGGQSPTTNQTTSVTIATTGNSSSFGGLPDNIHSLAGCASATRALFSGGTNSGGSRLNVISFITFSSLGSASDFGDLTLSPSAPAATSSSTRGIIAGGSAPTSTNVIEFVTIASAGNATDFGDLTDVTSSSSATSNSTLGLFGGGVSSGGITTNVISYITIASTGNAIDVGDLGAARSTLTACSGSHGGI
jgi:hypothetical protein